MMLKCVFVLGVTFLINLKLTSQIAYNHSILWEIRKNDSAQVSYVLGTFHQMDTSHYRLPTDTFIKLIAQCGNLCLEKDYNSSKLRSFYAELSQYKRGDLNTQQVLDRKYYKKLTSNLEKTGFPKREIRQLTKKKKFGYFYLILPLLLTKHPENKYNYFMDVSLLKYAKSGYFVQIIGLENMDSVTSYMREYYSNIPFLKAQLENSLSDSIDVVLQNKIWMDSEISTYVKQEFSEFNSDIDTINDASYYDSIWGGIYHYNIHTQRNIAMANGIDSLYKLNRKLFIAIGASHLFGKYGILNLLNNKGYMIKPHKVEIKKK